MDIQLLLIIITIAIVFVVTLVIINTSRKKTYIKQNLHLFNQFNKEVSLENQKYLTKQDKRNLINTYQKLYSCIKKIRLSSKNQNYSVINSFIEQYKHIDEFIKKRNQEYINQECLNHIDVLSSIDGNTLDNQQKTAVVTEEKHNLVLAGAGSGKTFTIVAKVNYLCKVKGLNPEDILLLSFTNNAADEMTHRIQNCLGINLEAKTFHKLGLEILTCAHHRRPDVKENELPKYIRNFFEKEVANNEILVESIIKYFAYYVNIPFDYSDYEKYGEIIEREKTFEYETLKSKFDRGVRARAEQLETLNSEKVRSPHEVMIANYLFIHGVKYEYESRYPFDIGNRRNAYHPDFYLPEYNLYLEHFGITSQGRVPWLSSIEEKKYLEGIKWKRDVHRNNGTKLIETYSYYAHQGILEQELEKLLIKNGVKLTEPNYNELYLNIMQNGIDAHYREFIKLVCSFVELFRSNDYDVVTEFDNLNYKSSEYNNRFHQERKKIFLTIVRPILSGYQKLLEDNQSVDFSDMINKATKEIINGYRVHPFKYVIVDEYQDISVARFRLIKSILDQTGAHLLCVGDDWQSIYRFAGSDISLFTDFEKNFGDSEILKIEKTYRNPQELVDVAQSFIKENPKQLQKKLVAGRRIKNPVNFYLHNNSPFDALKKIMDDIIADNNTDKTILFLGRTVYDKELLKGSGLFEVKDNLNNTKVIYRENKNINAEFLTIHKAKGLGADNVVLLNFSNNILGFPNKIADDPILELVLTEGDDYAYAEERRLLYVALTRSKNRVYVIVPANSPSEFYREFADNPLLKCVEIGEVNTEVKCPHCQTGHMIVRKNEATNRYFAGCSNYPLCDYTVSDPSIIQRNYRCTCGGFFVRRHGPHGDFWGCSNYPFCKNTRDM